MDVGSDKGNIRSDINVTPLVDVCLVLLIIFMVVTPLLSRGQVVLPKTHDPSKDPESNKQVTLMVEYANPPVYEIDNNAYSKSDFAKALIDLYQRTPSKQIVIKADQRLTWADVRDVMQMTKDAGFEDVGIIAERQNGGSS